jgi:hypothetical protein
MGNVAYPLASDQKAARRRELQTGECGRDEPEAWKRINVYMIM